ncbi:MAG: SDR family NAD(P)-dependent oxidoreductase [Candidatus Aminicenantes bacterium]|jgi:acyl transferase domain-containing protein
METNEPTGFEIAVIGMAGRFPKASDIDEFWDNLKNGVEAISFLTEEEFDKYKIGPEMRENPNYVSSKGGALEEKDLFDAAFFGYTPKEAEIMNPQLRHFHECAWEALENAGYDADSYKGLIGVYASASSSFYWKSLCHLTGRATEMGAFATQFFTDSAFVGTKISHKLNLKGPSSIISTACSSSLVAIHMGCRGILSGECDIALAGGVCIRPKEMTGYFYQEGMIDSADGHCRAFDAKAKGVVGGDGCGIVVLKILDNALENGDYIHAVIKSSAINNDGNRKVGYTAPSIEGQAEVIRTAQRLAEVSPESITYVETHGTATELGDTVEIAALKEAFNTDKKGYCAIGSVKTNLGHLDHAAGVAGFIKTVLALKYKIIPPSLHYETPNPKIEFIDTPFFVNNTASNWESSQYPRRAGVSSFGIGGTNAHVILEEAPEGTRGLAPLSDGKYQLILLSAKTQSALHKSAENLVNYLKRNPQTNLADAAYTLKIGRKAFPHRLMTVCSNLAEVIEALSSQDPHKVHTFFSTGETCNVVFMFSGPGPHYVNMGLELYQKEPVFREEMDRCSEILNPLLGYDIKEIIYPGERKAQGAERKANKGHALYAVRNAIDQTEIAQLAVFILEYALARLLMKWGITPHSMIGEGVGEYTAACLSGVFSLEDAIRLAVLKGKQGQEKGSYSAELETQVSRIQLNQPQIPFISNTGSCWITVDEALDHQYWVNHLQAIGQRNENIAQLFKNKNAVFVDVGVGGSLRALVRQHANKNANQWVLDLVKGPGETAGELYYLLHQIGRLWVYGVNVDWQKFYTGENRYRLPLPTYPFERQSYRIEGNPFRMGAELLQQKSLKVKKPDIADWFYLPSWKRSALLPSEPMKYLMKTRMCWMVFEDSCGLGLQLVKQLKQRDQDVIVVKPGATFEKTAEDQVYTLNPGKNTDYDSLFKELRAIGNIPQHILHLWSVTQGEKRDGKDLDLTAVERIQDSGFYSLLYLAQAIGKRDFDTPFRITALSNNMQNVNGEEEMCPEKATLLGAVKVIPQEYSNITCSSIDIVPLKDNWNDEHLVCQLMLEFSAEIPDKEVAYRSNYRWLPAYEPIRLERNKDSRTRLRKQGVYLITGGLGGIGLELAEHLAAQVGAKLILTGRSAFPAREEWEQWLETHDEADHISRKIKKIQKLGELGSEVLICKADAAKRPEMLRVITQAKQRFGQINAVIHSAGLPDGCVIPLRNRETTDEILAPKVTGTLVLDHVLKDFELDFFVICSSLTSIVALFGQVGYSAANAFQDAFVYQKNSPESTFTTAINWDTWKEVGMGVDTFAQLAEDENIKDVSFLLENAMLTPEAIDVFDRILESRLPQVVVSTSDLMFKIRERERGDLSEPVQVLDVEAHQGKLYPRPELSTEYVPPRTEFEKTFANILKKFFGYDQVGIHDNFFEFGVTSLTIIRINSLLRDEIHKIIPIVVMFEYPTIASLGQYLEKEEKGEPFVDMEVAEAEELETAEELFSDSIDIFKEDNW